MKYSVPLGLAIIALVSYLFTLPADVYLEDSGELIAASYHLGIAHPSGYPLYLLLGKLFSILPFGTIAYRLNLMSAGFAAATAVALFFLLRELAILLKQKSSSSDLLAGAIALLFVLSRDFWSQAIVAEVYSLHTFIVVLALWLCQSYLNRPSAGKIFALAYLSGLGLGNHLLFIFLLPLIWLLVFWPKLIQVSPRQYLAIVGLFILGLSVYLYLPIRVGANPEINFGHLDSWKDVGKHILRSDYNDLAPNSLGKGPLFSGFGESMIENLSWLIPGGMLLGIWMLLLKRRPKILLLTAGGALLTLGGIILLRSASYSETTGYVYRVYYFQIYLFILVLAFIGFASLPKKFRLLFFAVLISLAAYQGIQNYHKVNLAQNPVSEYYSKLLDTLPGGAVYLTIGQGYDYDSEVFVLLYLQKVRRMRLDVTILDASGVLFDPRSRRATGNFTLAELRTQYLNYALKVHADRPIFANFPAEAYRPDLRSYPTGLAFAVRDLENSENFVPNLDVDLSAINHHPRGEWDLAFRDFVAAAKYKQAAYWLYHGYPNLAYQSIVQAINFDNQVDSEDYRAFRIFREAALTKGKS